MKIRQLINKILPFGFIGLLFLSGCFKGDPGPSDYEVQLEKDLDTIEKFIEDNNVVGAVFNDFGFYEREIDLNPDGEIVETGDIAGVYYRITLLDGSLVDEKFEPEIPIHFTYGGNLIRPQFFELALSQMRVGERSEFYFPSVMSYVDYYNDPLIPQFSNIRLEIEFLRIDDDASLKELETERINTYAEENDLGTLEDFGDGLFYAQLEAGDDDTPNNLDYITVHYVGTFLDGKKFDSSLDRSEPITFRLGSGQVIDGWEQGFANLSTGEKGILFIPSHLAYGNNFFVAPQEIGEDLVNQGILNSYLTDIPPFATLVFEVEVIEITQ